MKRAFYFTAACAALALAASSSSAQICSQYTGPNLGAWQFADNWSLLEPSPTVAACISADKSVRICAAVCQNPGGPDHGKCCGSCIGGTCTTVSDARAKGLTLSKSPTSRGRVTFDEAGRFLILYDHSYIDGDIIGRESTGLKIAKNLTITGNGGTIVGYYYPNYFRVISASVCVGGAKDGDECTSDANCPPGLPTSYCDTSEKTLTTQGVDNASESTSLVLRDYIDMCTLFVNNAYFVADATLSEVNRPASGNGYWVAKKASTSAGTLEINATVTGPGTWRLIDDAGAKIEFNAACTGLTGKFDLKKGKLVVNQGVETTGNLDMRSEMGSEPQIDVASGKWIMFSK